MTKPLLATTATLQQPFDHHHSHHHLHQRQRQRARIREIALITLAVVVYVTFRNAASSSTFMSDTESLLTISSSTPVLSTTSTSSSSNTPLRSTPTSSLLENAISKPSDLYKPAPVEQYIIEHTAALGWKPQPPNLVKTCTLWKDPSVTPYFKELQQFATQELVAYYKALMAYQLPTGITDLRHQHNCTASELHPHGLQGIFTSQQLSHTQSGYVEPLLPPMRHMRLCLEDNVGVNGNKLDVLMSLQYLVHDWATICQKLKPTSRTVFLDLGASLQFHGSAPSPALVLLEQFRRMGVKFDHIYAYEMRLADPNVVFRVLPKQYRAAFHWINVGVEHNPNSIHNPWNMILDHYHEDDFVVVKLDIDTPAIEHPLAYQLLNNPQLAKLVDHFYFEHHVNQDELYPHWGPTTESVEQSFQLFYGLRQLGVAAHFWV